MIPFISVGSDSCEGRLIGDRGSTQANTLEAYYTYEFKLSAKPCSRNPLTGALACIDSANAYASVWVTVDPDAVVAKVAGGDRIAGTDTVLTLDGNVTFDPSHVKTTPRDHRTGRTLNVKTQIADCRSQIVEC